MDDPLFDPWGVGPEQPRTDPGASPRWRAPSSPPELPQRAPKDATSDDRLPGTAGFLRSMATPRFRDAAHRLRIARHHAEVDDLLDRTPPTLQLRVRIGRRLLPAAPDVEGTLVLAVDDAGTVTLRSRLASSASTNEVRVPPSHVSATWLEDQMLEFVRGLLSRA